MRVSIIIPCKDRQKLLERLISQISEQISERPDVEVIVVDDGTEPPLHVKTTEQIHLIRCDHNRGANAARELGFLRSRGAYIHFHDSDDLLGPNWVNAMLAAIDQSPAPDMIITSRLVIDEGGSVSFSHVDRVSSVSRNPARLQRYQTFINRIGPIGGVTFSRKTARNIVFHRTPASQDWLMYDDALSNVENLVFDRKNYFIFNKTEKIRISKNATAKARGYLYAAKIRFTSRRIQRLAARLYCAHGASDLKPNINVKYRFAKRAICELFARSFDFARVNK